MHPYLRLRLTARPADGEPAEPPPAPLLRRVLGKALVDGFCPFGKPHCQPSPQAKGRPPAPQELCRLAEACPYGVLFAASLSPRPPFALHVPAEAGEEAAQIELTLLGDAWRFYPWAVSAVQQALAGGLGKERRPWLLESIARVRPDGGIEELCGGEIAALPTDLEPDLLGLAVEPFVAAQPVTVDFVSPVRLIEDGHLVRDGKPVTLGLLVARILDRFAGLFGEASSEVLRPEIRAAVESEAARVPTLADETEWVEVKDYSARSRSELLMGGKVGRVVFGPEAARLLPILKAGEVLHVGKNPTTGCGRIEVSTGVPLTSESPEKGGRLAEGEKTA